LKDGREERSKKGERKKIGSRTVAFTRTVAAGIQEIWMKKRFPKQSLH